MTTRSSLPAARGFTLLEVMVAVAILAVGISVLLQVQSRSILMAQQAQALTVATQLARAKRLDCEQDLMKKGFSIGDYNEEGNFDEEGYPDFYWECHAYEPDLPVPDAAQIAQGGGQAAAEKLGLGGGAGAGGQDPMANMGMGMLAPILSQISQVVKESIREMVVIVRWQEGNYWEEMRVATHMVDPARVNAIAQQMGAMTGGGIPGLPGAGGGGNSGRGGTTAPNSNNLGGARSGNSSSNQPFVPNPSDLGGQRK